MPVIYQQQINEDCRLGIWKIEENEAFFKGNVPLHREVTHPHKRLQHLAGRFLLQYLFPDFPYELIKIADTRKPFLPDEEYHFSISHCGDYAAAIVSKTHRVGIDVEEPKDRILRVANKFLNQKEWSIVNSEGSIVHDDPKPGTLNPELLTPNSQLLTLFWSAKEAVFKWYGDGLVDFSADIQLNTLDLGKGEIDCYFVKANADLVINFELLDGLVCSWVRQ